MILSRGRSMTMVIQEECRWTVPISLIYDGSDLSEKALKLASHLAGIRKGSLNVFIAAPHLERARRFRSRIEKKSDVQQVNADFYIIANRLDFRVIVISVSKDDNRGFPYSIDPNILNRACAFSGPASFSYPPVLFPRFYGAFLFMHRMNREFTTKM